MAKQKKDLFKGIVLIILVVFTILGIAQYQFLVDTHEKVKISVQREEGLRYMMNLQPLLFHISKHGLDSHQEEFQEFADAESLAILDKQIAVDFSNLAVIEANSDILLDENDSQRARQRNNKLISQWNQLKQIHIGLDPQSVHILHSNLIRDTRNLIEHVLESSQVGVDPKKIVANLSNTLWIQLPEVQEILAQMVAVGTKGIQNKMLTSFQREEMLTLVSFLRSNLESMKESFAKVQNQQNEDGEKYTALAVPYEHFRMATNQFLDTSETEILKDEPININAAEFFEMAHKAYDANEDFSTELAKSLAIHIDENSKKVNHDRLLLMTSYPLALFIAIGMAWVLTRRSSCTK